MLLSRLLWWLPGPRVVLCSDPLRTPQLWAVFFGTAASPLQVPVDSPRSRFSSLLFPVTHPASNTVLWLGIEGWSWLQMPAQTSPASQKESPLWPWQHLRWHSVLSQGRSESAAAPASWLGPGAEASGRRHTCQLSVRRQHVPPRHCPYYRGVTRL